CCIRRFDQKRPLTSRPYSNARYPSLSKQPEIYDSSSRASLHRLHHLATTARNRRPLEFQGYGDQFVTYDDSDDADTLAGISSISQQDQDSQYVEQGSPRTLYVGRHGEYLTQDSNSGVGRISSGYSDSGSLSMRKHTPEESFEAEPQAVRFQHKYPRYDVETGRKFSYFPPAGYPEMAEENLFSAEMPQQETQLYPVEPWMRTNFLQTRQMPADPDPSAQEDKLNKNASSNLDRTQKIISSSKSEKPSSAAAVKSEGKSVRRKRSTIRDTLSASFPSNSSDAKKLLTDLVQQFFDTFANKIPSASSTIQPHVLSNDTNSEPKTQEETHAGHSHHHSTDHVIHEAIFKPFHEFKEHQSEDNNETKAEKKAMLEQLQKKSEDILHHLSKNDQGMDKHQAFQHIANYNKTKVLCNPGSDRKCEVKFFTFCADPFVPKIGFRMILFNKYRSEPRMNNIRHLGCFKDRDRHNMLVDIVFFENTNSPHTCIAMCQKLGYQFAALEHGFECWCQQRVPNFDDRTDQRECDANCPGGPWKTCGGNETIDIYDTGIHFGTAAPRHAFIGCVQDKLIDQETWPARIYNGRGITDMDCISLCKLDDYRLFGLDHSHMKCFCGSHLPANIIRVGEKIDDHPKSGHLRNLRVDVDNRCLGKKNYVQIFGLSYADDDIEHAIEKSLRISRQRSPFSTTNPFNNPMLTLLSPFDIVDRILRPDFTWEITENGGNLGDFLGIKSRKRRFKRGPDLAQVDEKFEHIVPILRWDCASVNEDFNQSGTFQLKDFSIDGATFVTERLVDFNYTSGAVCRLYEHKLHADQNPEKYALFANCPAPPMPVADLSICQNSSDDDSLPPNLGDNGLNQQFSMLVNWTRPYDRAGVPVTSFELDCHSENGVKCSISASTAEIVSQTGVHTVTVDSHNGESRCLCSIRSHANGLWSPWSPSAPEICVRSETRNWTVTMDGYRYLHPDEGASGSIFRDVFYYAGIAVALAIAIGISAALAFSAVKRFKKRLADDSSALFATSI
ncbi:unnamed protein product, partial [Notodromas monacha]